MPAAVIAVPATGTFQHIVPSIAKTDAHHQPSVVKARYARKRANPDEQAAALFDEGEYEYDAGEYTAARRIFEALVAKFPSSQYALKAQRYLARIYADSRSEEAAAPVIRKTTDDNRPVIEPRPEPRVAAPSATVPAPPELGLVPDKQLQNRLLRHAGDRVFFAVGSAELGAKARIALRRQAAWLRQQRAVTVQIAGYADEPGDAADNLELSRARAEAVRQRLIEEGVDKAILKIVAYGRSQPVALCESTTCAAQNRRVMTLILIEKLQGLKGPHQSRRSAWSTNRR
ncbi:MAG: OmpA family protein [Hyphomicrobiaceae bacterium]